MKAITVAAPGGLDRLKLVDVSEPGVPGAGEIRVRVRASSINFHDYAVARGFLPAADGRIPLADGAGVVEAIGAGVTEFAVGDCVVSGFFPTWLDGSAPIADFSRTPGDGLDGYAREVVVTPATWFTKAPKGFSHAEAATLTTAGLTAWRALIVEGGIKAGDTVLVMGTGGVSIFALQFAKMMGATVIATSSSDQKLERVKALGADYTINYKSEPEWGGVVQRLTGGLGVDHVVETGGPGTLSQSFLAVRTGGRIYLIGTLTRQSGDLPFRALMTKNARLQGILVGSRRQQQDMVRGIEAGGLRPVLDRSFPLARLADAFRHEESGQHFGKISIEI
ncbi:MAG TPA: NAD(P)-dependent alcohol dehydrogenase [Steroidobacteraceae bacterium]|nr:NAD(P)-dependent alcohol dehydrogenase [Steroidobacteraceae bacterium]